jgi:AraC family ethanolamine operon transcriptional activator
VEFEGTIAGSSGSWVATIDEVELLRAYESMNHKDFPAPQGRVTSLRPATRQLRRLREFATRTATLAKESPSLLADDRIRKKLHLDCVHLVSRSIASATIDNHTCRGAQKTHTQIVRIVEGFVDSVVEQPVSITELCSLADVCERTLERAFLDVVGVTPQFYLKAVRLKRARAQLESASPAATVTTAALAAGFFHLGRFAGEYRRFFGELPSDTLLRRQSER